MNPGSAGSRIRVVVALAALLSGDGAELRYVCVDDLRYTGGQLIEPGIWARLRIPLSDLYAAGRPIQRFSIKNYSAASSVFQVDEIRLAGARWNQYLPLSARGRVRW